jgi:hypothetical protein
VPQEVCCNDGTSTDGCNADPGNCGNQHLDCNDDADCGGMKCCAEKSGPNYIDTRCKSVCGGSDAHVCDTGTQISTLPTGYDFCP